MFFSSERGWNVMMKKAMSWKAMSSMGVMIRPRLTPRPASAVRWRLIGGLSFRLVQHAQLPVTVARVDAQIQNVVNVLVAHVLVGAEDDHRPHLVERFIV